MPVVIGTLTLTNVPVWVDRNAWQGVAQSRRRTVDGGQVVFSSPLSGGRPVTLEAQPNTGWLKKSEADALLAMSEVIGATYAFEYGDFEETVEFDHADGPGTAVQLEPLIPRSTPGADDWFVGTVRLRTI